MSSHSHRSSQIWTCVHISKGSGMFEWKPHPSPWHRIPKGFVMFGWRLHPKLSSMELPQSRFCPLENLANNDPFPRDAPDHSCRVFKLSLREQPLDFSSLPFSSPLWRTGKSSESILSIKPGHYVIWSDLVWCNLVWLLRRWKGLFGVQKLFTGQDSVCLQTWMVTEHRSLHVSKKKNWQRNNCD